MYYHDLPKTRTLTKRIDYVERLVNSSSGNPRYRVYFTDGSRHRTMPDADVNYGITNMDYYGCDIRVELEKGLIIRVSTE